MAELRSSVGLGWHAALTEATRGLKASVLSMPPDFLIPHHFRVSTGQR
jgi:hypothetical protein